MRSKLTLNAESDSSNLNHSNMRQAIILSIATVAISFSVIGCERPEDPMMKVLQATASQTKVDDLSRTMDFVFSERQFDQSEFNNTVSLGLNRWANYSADKFSELDWKEDASIKEIIAPYANSETSLPSVDRISDSSFLAKDSQYLQAIAWMDKIANRVKDKSHLGQFELYRLMADDFEPEDDDKNPIDSVFSKLNPDLGPADAKDLSLAVRLFDWVTRNVQLQETPSYTDEELEDLKLVDADTLPGSGVVSLGAKRTPWHMLIFARGDYVEKAKLFMSLCHQSDLNTVMFATGEDTKPWAVGVLIGKEWFLFDTQLGLPIPGSDGRSIATLSDVREDANLLSKLDLTVQESLADDTKYWVTEEDLATLTGLVYWTPESASHRIAALESGLVGNQRLILTQRADETIASLPAVKDVEYKPWDISLQTRLYRKVIGESLANAVTDDATAQKLSWYFNEEGYVMAFPNYRTGRTRFLNGKFEVERDVPSRDAIESFAILMYDDATIAGLETDRDLQKMIGIRKAESAGQTPAEFDRDIRSRQQQMRLVRRDAGVYMCQAHFDNGNISTTANWIPKLLEKDDVERWTSSLNYLGSRAYEARHQYDEAIELLKAEGPQQHGNLIRARLIKNEIKTQFASKKSEQ